VRGNHLIFIAGQAAVDASGTVVGGDNVEEQAEQAFRNVSAALESVGCTAANRVKLTVFMRDMTKLTDCRRARDRFSNSVSPPVVPAVTLVEVSRSLLGAAAYLD
jgi:enamine deaminase RidA (YjgF/YER057c/UK114 family)